MARSLPMTSPEGRFIRFETADSGYLVSFYQSGSPMPGLQELHISQEDQDRLARGFPIAVIAPGIGKLELLPDAYDIRFWLGVTLVGQMNRRMWGLGLKLANKAYVS